MITTGKNSPLRPKMDELVHSVAYYNPRPLLFHGYLAPFFVLQAAVFYYFTSHQLSTKDADVSATKNETSTEENFAERHSYEIGVIAVAISFAAQVITYLFCHWSVDVKCWLCYTRCRDPHVATYVKVKPTPNNGSTELVPLNRTKLQSKQALWFVFQKAKYVYKDKAARFQAVEFPCDKELSYYRDWKGYQDQEEVQSIERHYGRNELEMVIPEFWELFKERATAPFFVFQVFCVGLWCLDEFWYYSVFTLFMLVTFEVMLVKNQLRNMAEIRRMGNQPWMVQVYRQQKWRTIRSDQLVHGDLIAIVRAEHSVPCDILLVRGSCIVDESTLTGESIPQMKEPIEDLVNGANCDAQRSLDISRDKLHVLFGGTKVLQHTAPGKEPGCVGYVLRTGFHTSQGKLLRTILFGVKRVTANSFETFCFIMFLLFFAMISAYYVWTEGVKDPSRSRYRLFFECTVIITSVIPPELPIELSLAVNTSLISLSKLFIYCTEPFRIPFAGKVEYCCFDKTGTLTSDDLKVEGVAGLSDHALEDVDQDHEPSASEEASVDKQATANETSVSLIKSHLSNSDQIKSIQQCPSYTKQVLASCHSLVHLDEKLVGDPLEKKVLEAVNWTYSKSGIVTPKKGRSVQPLKIHQRFHFNSTLKRMSVVASYKPDLSNENVYICTAKGAPEFIRPLLKSVPQDYDETYLQMSRLGARVLALGYRTLGQLSNQELSELKREDVEQDLMFAGFILISCPLKPDSQEICNELISSGHRLVMITGDGALTSCHVASILNFVQKEVLILTKACANGAKIVREKKEVRFEDWAWVSADQKTSIAFNKVCDEFVEFSKKYDLCLTGDSIDFITKDHKESLAYEIIRRVKVFARVSPKQKELIITTLKSRGASVLMCGDGTNDVGALKHADVGVALLSASSLTQVPKLLTQAAKIQQQLQLQKEQILKLSAAQNSANENINPRQQITPKKKQVALSGKTSKQVTANHHHQQLIPVAKTPEEKRREKILEAQAKFKELLEEQERGQFVKLGDASIAAPFTSRLSSTQCISHIIKQGRCTLVTTLQMFKILALNALLSAYCHSVLYLDGIKFSDSQITIQGLLSTFCFLFITRSQPLSKLSAQRPLPNIFNLYTILTVTFQFAIHFLALVFLYSQAKIFQASLDATNSTAPVTTSSSPIDDILASTLATTQEADDLVSDKTNLTATNATSDSSTGSALHTEFKASLINSTVYIIWMSVQLATFVVNYKGHPFMQDLRNNMPLCYSFLGSALVVFSCVNGWSSGLIEQLSVVEFPLEFRPVVLGTIVADFVGAFVIDRICEYLFGRVKLKPL